MIAFEYIKIKDWDFHGGPVVKNPACNTRDSGSIPGWGTKIPHARQPKDKQQQKKLKINKKSKEAEGREVEKQLLCYHKL